MGDDEITDNGAETTACGGGGSAVDPSPAPAGGIGNVSNAFDNELLRIREQEAEKERHASVQAMTSRLIANAANGGSSGSSSHADESGGVGWSSEKSSKKSQGARSVTRQTRQRSLRRHTRHRHRPTYLSYPINPPDPPPAARTSLGGAWWSFTPRASKTRRIRWRRL